MNYNSHHIDHDQHEFNVQSNLQLLLKGDRKSQGRAHARGARTQRALRRLAMRNKTQGKPERSTRVNIKQCVLFTEKLWVCFLRWETK